MISNNKWKNQIYKKKYSSYLLLLQLLFLAFFSVTFAEGQDITVSSIGPGASSNRTSKANSSDTSPQMWVLSLAIDPRPSKADTMYRGNADTLLFKTDDMASFRRLASTTVDGNLIPQVGLDPDNPDIVYASANFRLYKSTDGGDNWTEITGWKNPYGPDIARRDNAARFAIDPNSSPGSRTIYVTVYAGGVYKTTDGGQNWTGLSSEQAAAATPLSGVYIDPSNSNRIYLGTFSLMHYSQQDTGETYSIYFSDDGGITWKARGNLPATNRIWIDPKDGERLLAVTIDTNTANNKGGIYLTMDGGQNWTRVMDQPIMTDIILDPHVTDRMWALSTTYYQDETGVDISDMNPGLYKSLDRGKTWQREDVEFNHYSLYPIVAHPTRTDELYIGTSGLGVKKVVFSDNPTLSDGPTPSDDTVLSNDSIPSDGPTPLDVSAPSDVPVPDIKANNSDGTVTIRTGATLTVSISLDAGDSKGKDCDWWVSELSPTGWYYYSLYTSWTFTGSSHTNLLPTHQGALSDLDSYNVLNTSGLSEGTHTFYFAIDTNMNGEMDLDQMYHDSVVVNVTK